MSINDMENTDKHIKYYYEHIGDGYFKKALSNYSESRGFGIEDIWCCFANEFEAWEEDYFGEEGVAYYFDYPAVEKDCIVILSYSEFYKYLTEACEEYIKRNVNEEKEVKVYLKKIKENFKL